MAKKKPAPPVQHFGIFTHSHGRKVAAYARKSEQFGGYVLYDAQSGRRVSGDRVYPTLAAALEGEPFVANESGVKVPAVAEPPKKP